jgi:hypothetical protein
VRGKAEKKTCVISASPRAPRERDPVNYLAARRRGPRSNGGSSAAGAGGSNSAAMFSFGPVVATAAASTASGTSAFFGRARDGVRRLKGTSLSRGFRQGTAASRRPQPYFLNTSSMAVSARGSCFWPSQKAAFLRTLRSRCVFINSMSIGTD